jgi:hypothetical protein
MDGTCSTYWIIYMKNAYKFFTADAKERNLLEVKEINRRVEGEKPLGRPRHRWVRKRREIFWKTTVLMGG